MPDPPKEMPAVGKRMWRELVGLMAPSGVLDKTDRYQLELLCSTYAEWKHANAEYTKQPIEVGSKGQPVRSPWWDIQHAARESLRKLLVEMGLTPAARTKLGILQQREDGLAKKLTEIFEG